MARYEHYDGSDLGGDIGGFFGGIVAGAMIAFLIVIAMELYRLHAENPPWAYTEAGEKTRLAGLLFLGSIGLSVLLAQFPATISAAPYPVSIGFLKLKPSSKRRRNSLLKKQICRACSARSTGNRA